MIFFLNKESYELEIVFTEGKDDGNKTTVLSLPRRAFLEARMKQSH